MKGKPSFTNGEPSNSLKFGRSSFGAHGKGPFTISRDLGVSVALVVRYRTHQASAAVARRSPLTRAGFITANGTDPAVMAAKVLRRRATGEQHSMALALPETS